MASTDLFSPGMLLASPEATALMKRSGTRQCDLLARHVRGDWPDLAEPLRQANVQAVKERRSVVVGAFVLDIDQAGAANDDREQLAHVALITEPGRLTILVTSRQAKELLAGWSKAAPELIRLGAPAIIPPAIDVPLSEPLSTQVYPGRGKNADRSRSVS